MTSDPSPIKLPFEITDARRSGLRALLALLDLPPRATAVDVGAGGFLGQTTTEPILEILGGKIICIEANSDLSAALGAKMGDRIVNICGFYGEVGAREPHDLVVIDIDTARIFDIFDRLLDYAVQDGLKPGGFLVSVVVYNPDIAYEETNGLLAASGKSAQEAFLRRYFGSCPLDTSILARKFESHPEFKFVALVDKSLGEGRNSVGWLVLRRRLGSADRLPRPTDSASPVAVSPPRAPAFRVPAELTDVRRSGFRALLSLLRLPANPTVVDIGAGGNQGDTTTDHLVDMVPGRIIGMHPSTEICETVRQKYGDRVEMMQGVYGRQGVGTEFDLIIFDIRPVSDIFLRLLEFVLPDGLRPGGFVVSIVVLDVKAAYEREAPLFPEGERAADGEFNLSYFGSERLDTAAIARTFERHPDFELMMVVDRWIGDEGLAWVVLRRRAGPGRRQTPSALAIPMSLTDLRRDGFRAALSMIGAPANAACMVIAPDNAAREEAVRQIRDVAGREAKTIDSEAAFRRARKRFQRFAMRVLRRLRRRASRPDLRDLIDVLAPIAADLIVVDVQARIAAVYERLIPYLVAYEMSLGGFIIASIVYHPAVAFPSAEESVRRERKSQETFLKRYFGAEKVDAALLARKYARHPTIEFVALVDRRLGEGRNSTGWVVLRRRIRE